MDVAERGKGKIRTETGDEFDYVLVDGKPRLLACLPSPNRLLMAKAGVTAPSVPLSELKPRNNAARGIPILNQGQHGSCVGHGSCTAAMNGRDKSGMTFQLLSPTSMYAQINGGRDAGASITDSLSAGEKTGFALMSEVPESVIYMRQIQQSAWTTAARFRFGPEQFTVNTWADILAAIMLDYAMPFGAYVGGSYGAVDAEGIATGGISARGANHCQAFTDIYFSTRYKEWCVEVTNSWGESWGQGGRIRVREKDVMGSNGPDEVYVASMLYDPQDPAIPPIPV